jgi:hypothetical protein
MEFMHEAVATNDKTRMDQLTKQANRLDVNDALEVPIAFTPQMVAWDSNRVVGNVKVTIDTCQPDDYSGLGIRK